MKIHEKQMKTMHTCFNCAKIFTTRLVLNRHLKHDCIHLPIEDMTHLMDDASLHFDIEFFPALNGCFSKYTFTPSEHISNEKVCLEYLEHDIPALLEWYHNGNVFLKWGYTLDAMFTRLNNEGEAIFKKAGFSLIDLAHTNADSMVLKEQFNDMRNDIVNRVDRYSGWILCKVLSFKLYLYRYKLNYGGSGKVVTIPYELAAKHCVLNIDSSSNCFKWAVLAALHYHEVDPHSTIRTPLQ